MEVRIKETGEVVDVEYDDDDLYVVIGRRQYLYASEFDVLSEPEEEVRIDKEEYEELCKYRRYCANWAHGLVVCSHCGEFNPEGYICANCGKGS